MSHSLETTTFPTQLAVELGDVHLAIIVQFFCNVINHHIRLKRNFIDGSTWNYCTRAELAAHFPFMKKEQIRRCLEKLIKKGILKVGNYNKMKSDNTRWYAFVDEKKYGILPREEGSGESARGSGKIARGSGKIATAIPQTTIEEPPIYKVNDGASPPLTPSMKKKESVFKGKVRYSKDQMECLDWLLKLDIDTSSDTLSWWARTYSLPRLMEVYEEAVRRKPKSIGAYMQKLLKKEAIVITDKIQKNREYATFFKELFKWDDLKIHEKYAVAGSGNQIEIDFNMDLQYFKEYINNKFQNLSR